MSNCSLEGPETPIFLLFPFDYSYGQVHKERLYNENRFAISHGQVDQLEDRYLGMVEAAGSNPPLSTLIKSILLDV